MYKYVYCVDMKRYKKCMREICLTYFSKEPDVEDAYEDMQCKMAIYSIYI